MQILEYRLILIFLLHSSTAFAQPDASVDQFQINNQKLRLIDSLEGLLKQHRRLDTFRVDLQNRLGYEHWIIDPSSSESYGLEAIELAQILDYKPGLAFANRVVGVSHWVRGSYFLAFQFLYDSHELYQFLDDSLGMANTTLNIGMVYQGQDDDDNAIIQFEEAIRIFKNLKAPGRVATAQTKWAGVLLKRNAFDEAYLLLTQALQTHKDNGFQYGIAEVNKELGDLHRRKGQYEIAIAHLLASIEAGSERFDQVGIAANYQMIGDIYLANGDIIRAETYLNKSKNLAEEFSLREIQESVYESLIKLAKKKNQNQQAIFYYDKYITIVDSIRKDNSKDQISSLTSQYKNLQKEKELQLAQQQIEILKQQRKSGNLLKIIYALGLLFIGSVGWQLYKRQQNKINLGRKKLEAAQTERDNLKSTIKEREKELTSFTVNFVQKNKLLQELKTSIRQVKMLSTDVVKKKLDSVERLIDNAVRIDEDWEDFKLYFESTHADLLKALKLNYPELTSNDLRLLALVRLNMSTKEIGAMLGISPESAKTARYRLRKKMKLETQVNLFDHLLELES